MTLVIFDLDGTLVDSRADIATSIDHSARAVGAPPVAREAVFPLIGQPLVAMFETLLSAEFKARAEDAAAIYRRHYFDHCADATAIYPGVLACLDRLDGVPKAVATTKMTFMAVEVLKQLGLTDRFALVQGCDGIPHKPDPAVVQLVLEKLGAPADQSWMVGDTVYDIQAGRAAGTRTCAVTYGIGSAVDLAAENPDLLLDNLDGFRL
jgi:phosphoglycolate phosphatase